MPIHLKNKPAITLGAERSGTTLLMAMIGCHPRITVPEVAWCYPRFRPYLHACGNLGREENFRAPAAEMVRGPKTPFRGRPANPCRDENAIQSVF
jgi:hypothetical protein